MPPRQVSGSANPNQGLPDAEVVEAAFMVLSDGADEADADSICCFFEVFLS